jgi:hypothetical protein
MRSRLSTTGNGKQECKDTVEYQTALGEMNRVVGEFDVRAGRKKRAVLFIVLE